MRFIWPTPCKPIVFWLKFTLRCECINSSFKHRSFQQKLEIVFDVWLAELMSLPRKLSNGRILKSRVKWLLLMTIRIARKFINYPRALINCRESHRRKYTCSLTCERDALYGIVLWLAAGRLLNGPLSHPTLSGLPIVFLFLTEQLQDLFQTVNSMSWTTTTDVGLIPRSEVKLTPTFSQLKLDFYHNLALKTDLFNVTRNDKWENINKIVEDSKEICLYWQ